MWLKLKAAEQEWRDLLKREPCVYCGRRPDEIPGGTGRTYRDADATIMTIEHITPKGHRRRPVGWENLAPACWNCNNTRGSMPLLHYLLLRQGDLTVDALRHDRRRRAALTRARRRDRPEWPPPPPLTFTLRDLGHNFLPPM